MFWIELAKTVQEFRISKNRKQVTGTGEDLLIDLCSKCLENNYKWSEFLWQNLCFILHVRKFLTIISSNMFLNPLLSLLLRPLQCKCWYIQYYYFRDLSNCFNFLNSFFFLLLWLGDFHCSVFSLMQALLSLNVLFIPSSVCFSLNFSYWILYFYLSLFYIF